MQPVPVDARTVLRIRRAIERAAPPAAAVHEADWRRQRDELLDDFEAGRHADVSSARVRFLVDFLAEALPAREARLTPREWEHTVTAITDEVLSLIPR